MNYVDFLDRKTQLGCDHGAVVPDVASIPAESRLSTIPRAALARWDRLTSAERSAVMSRVRRKWIRKQKKGNK